MATISTIKSYKIKLYPNKEQEHMLFKIGGACRFIYNWSLNKQNTHFEEVREDDTIKHKFIGAYDMAKLITQLKKKEGLEWLSEVPKTALDGAATDCCEAFIKMFKGNAKRPRFKSRNKSKPAFLNRLDGKTPKTKVTATHINISKVGMVRYRGQIPTEQPKYSNCRITFDGVDWWASMGLPYENEVDPNKTGSIGVDLGIKDLAYLSTGDRYVNVNKGADLKKLEKKLVRMQRQLCRKYDELKSGEVYVMGEKPIKTQNIIKLEKDLVKLHRRITRKRDYYRHQLTSDLVNLNPDRIVLEQLNVKGMMKNKHLAKDIGKQGWYEINRQLEYKCKNNGITLEHADRWFASSKICSNCSNKKVDLKLSDRTYRCDACGLVINRDLNAAINLSKYAPGKTDK